MNANQSRSDGSSQNQSACQPSYRNEADKTEVQPILQSGLSIPRDENRSSRREYRWTKDARDLVRSNADVSGVELSALVTRLVEQTGYPRWACRRFIRRMGVRSKRPLKAWTIQEQQRLLKLLDLHPVK